MTNSHSNTARPGAARPLLGALRTLGLGLGLLIGQASWAAPTVSYVATNLADTTLGEDLWRYDYSFTGPIDAGGSLNLIFSHLSYSSLAASTGDSNLTLLPTQPDAGLMTDGIVYILPTNALASSDVSTLSVEFVWLIAGREPGSQGFEVVDASGNPAGGGKTTLPGDGNVVPEPASASLVLAALLGAGAVRRRKA